MSLKLAPGANELTPVYENSAMVIPAVMDVSFTLEHP